MVSLDKGSIACSSEMLNCVKSTSVTWPVVEVDSKDLILLCHFFLARKEIKISLVSEDWTCLKDTVWFIFQLTQDLQSPFGPTGHRNIVL